MAVHPLIPSAGATDQPEDIGVIDYPVKRSPAETAYQQTINVDPDHAAKVLGLSKTLDEHPQFVENNLDSAKAAAAMPTSDYFVALEKQHPVTHAYVANPKNMAVVKDDIDNLKTFEDAASGAVRAASTFVPGMFEKGLAEKTPLVMNALNEGWQAEKSALQSGFLQEQRDFLAYGKVIGRTQDSGTFSGQLFNRIMGVGAGRSPDERIADINAQLKDIESARPETSGPLSALKHGIYGATEFLPWMAGAATRGAEYAIPMGLLSAAAGIETGPGAVVTGGAGAATGFTIGEAEYNFQRMTGVVRNQLDQIHDDSGNPLPENIKNIAALAGGAAGSGLGMIRFGAILKTIPGGEAFLKGFQSEAGKAILNPATYKSSLAAYTTQWLRSTATAAGSMGALTAINIGVGEAAKAASGQKFPPFSPKQAFSEVGASIGDAALTFGVLGLPGTALGFGQTAIDIRRTEQLRDAYTAMGEAAGSSKLRQRLPEAYREFTESVTKGSPVENIGIPAETFDTYFQSKNIDPGDVAHELGVEDQVQAARESGGDINIPLSVWADKMVGTEHYEALKDDIRFHPEDMTVREAADARALLEKQIGEQADAAVKENPTYQDGRDFIYEDLKKQITATTQVDPKVADAQAKLGAAAITNLAHKQGMEPKEFYEKGPIRVVKGDEPIADTSTPGEKAANEFLGKALKTAKAPKIKKADIAARAGELLTAAQTSYESDRATFDSWREILKTGIKPSKEIGGQADVRDEYKQLPLWMKNKAGRGSDEVAQEAREKGLLAEGEDLFQKLREIKAPKKAGSADDYLQQAQHDLESQHYQTFLQSAIPNGDLFTVDKQNITDRFARYLKEGRDSGLDQGRAEKYAMDKLAAETKTVPADGTGEKQTEFGAGGVKGFGQGEQELFQSSQSTTDTPEFKNWFGDSKVVDEKGKPIVVYHGTDKNFSTFRKSKSTQGIFWFTSNKSAIEAGEVGAQGHGKVKELFASIKNPASWQEYEKLGLGELKARGYDGAILREKDGSFTGFVFESNQLKDANRNRGTFDQNNSNILMQGDPETDPRGFIRFTPKETLIGMVKADASTFPHELAHYWLRNFHEFIQSGTAKENHVNDWKTLSDWLKIEEGQKNLTTDQQEQFARGFEAYLREGKAPSEELRGVFGKFRRWLTRLYKDPIALGVELNDNVRAVMDRMLASEDEIAFAHRDLGPDKMAEINIEGIDPKVKARLESLRDQAHEEAVSKLISLQMKKLTDENKAFLSKEREKATADATAALAENQEYKAMDALKESFKKDPRKVAQDYIEKKLTAGDLDVFEIQSENSGYMSGDEMAKKILASPTKADAIRAAVDSRMAHFADLKNRPEMKEEAQKSVHSDKSLEVMAMERSIYQDKVDEAQGRLIDQRRRATEAKIEAATAKVKAQALIAAKPVADAGKFIPYFTAERNAAIKVQKALAAKDYQAAADAKRQQMLSHALAGESFKARSEIEKSMRFFDRFASRGQDLKNMQYGFIRQIDTLLSDRGLADPRGEDAQTYLKIAQKLVVDKEDPSEIAHQTGWMLDASGQWKQETLPETIARIQNDYRNIAIPPNFLTTPPQNYRRMPLAQFRDLKSVVQAINGIGRGYENFLDETIKTDIKTAAGEFRAYVEKNVGQKYLDARDVGSKPGETKFTKGLDAIRKLPDSVAPSLVNLLSFCDFLDAGKVDGPAKNFIYRLLKRGEDGTHRENDSAVKEMGRIHDAHWKEGEFEQLKKEKVYIASRDRDMTRDEILAVAFNQGTERNIQRVRDGYGFTERQLKEILSNVPKNHWDFVQAVWDHIDSYWPQIVALQQKVSGETPEKSSPVVVHTSYGDYRGGYYPLVYDYERSNEAFANIEARNALYKTAGPAVAHTEHGFTQSRVDNLVRPVKLDTNVMFTHLGDVIHDLNMRAPVVDVNRFLRQKDVREAIANSIGLEGYRTIEKHLKWVASDQGEYLSAGDKFIRRLRFGATVATLGLRPLQGPLSLSGNAINAIQDLGPVGFGNSVKDFLSDREANTAFVDSLSPRMANRSVMRDRDLNDMASRWTGKASVFQQYTFYFDSQSDKAISYPLWLAVYKKTVGEHGQQKAIDIADEAVTKAMGSGTVLDQAMIQRGSESQKIWSWWYSWSGMMFNRAWRDGKIAGLEYDKGNVGTALKITATSALFSFGLQGAVENLWREAFRNTQNVNEDKRAKRVALRMMMQPISYVPIAREIVQYGLEKAAGVPGGGVSLPFQGAMETMINPLAEMAHAQLEGKEMKQKTAEDTARLAAMVLKYPQILNTWAFNFIDFLNNEGDLTWRDLMGRRTKS